MTATLPPRSFHRGFGILAATLACTLLPIATAHAQSQLVPLVTNRTPLPLSNYFGMVSYSDVNQAGDYAFVVGGRTPALFLRRANDSAPVRVLQASDEAPGFPGSRVNLFVAPKLNASGLLAFGFDFALANGQTKNVIYTFDGTSFRRIALGLEPAPGCGGALFGAVSLVGLNDAGDVAFTGGVVATGAGIPAKITLFIAPAGGTPTRVIGLDDVAPGTGGTFASISPISFNNRGEVLFGANIVGGSRGAGLFVGRTGAVHKVVAHGDAVPGGGTFSIPTSVSQALLNNSGQVAFSANSAIWLSSPAIGIALAVAPGTPTPSGGTFNTPSLAAFSDAGAIAFTSTFSPNAGNGLFRFLPDTSTVQVVVSRNQSAPGTGGRSFQLPWSAISINAVGTVSFRATLSGGSAAFGLFQQEGSDPPVPVVLDDQVTTLPGGGTYALTATATRTLNTGAVWFRAYVVGGTAYYGEFLVTAGGTRVLMSTADQLPAGSNVSVKTYRPVGAADYVEFVAQRAGGGSSLALHDIAAQATTIVITEGDSAPGGGRIGFFVGWGPGFVNTGGSVAFAAMLTGGPGRVGTAIFLGRPGALARIVATGDTDPTTGRTFLTPSLGSSPPSRLNDASQVVFLATETGAPSLIGLFVGSASAPLKRVAATGQTAPDGRPFYSFPSSSVSVLSSVSLNQLGQVAFLAITGTSTDQRPGLYVFTPDSTPEVAEVVEAGDPGPAGSRFGSFGYAAFNNLGQLAFTATLTGGPAGGVFVSSSSVFPTALALDGQLAPAGGSFSITSALPDVAINDRGDVVFRSDLTGGSSDSGYFMRRTASGTLEKLVLQGEPALGTSGTFNTMVTGVNNSISENVQLDQAGNIAMMCRFQDPDGNKAGSWHVRPDGTLEEILVRGTVAPEFGGGTAVYSAQGTSWNSDGRFPMWAGVSGGTFTDAIFLFVSSPGTLTSAGTNIVVQPRDATTGQTPASVTFVTVTVPGVTTLTTSAAGPAIPSSFLLGDPPMFYNLSTTATFSGAITVCVDFSRVSFPETTGLRLLHYEGGTWADVTLGGGAVGTTICGQASSLSPFAVVRDVAPPAVAVTVTPSIIWPPNNKLVPITATIQASDPGDPNPHVVLVSITSNEALQPGDIQGATFGTDCGHFQLRATRSGGGNGRTYVITYRATDAAGNATEKTAHVTVPHDQGKQ